MEVMPSSGSRILVAFFATVFWGMGVRGLHNLEINVPGAVLVGETVTLECSWQLEDEEALYSVKWYRGREEFYRYIPKELPHTRVFPLPGIEVDISRSGARRVVLQQATPAMAGRFRCEVSADAPTFHTEIRSAPLEVVEPPEWGPKLVSDRSWYGVGSLLRATCASPPAYPPANLTFALNGLEIEMTSIANELPSWFKWDPPPKPETTTTELPEDDMNFNIFHDDSNIQYLDESYINLHKEEIRRPQKESPKLVFERTGPDNRLPSVGVVSFVVRTEAFERGTLRLTCIASLYNLYAARSELIFDMEQPEVASVLGVRNSAVGFCVLFERTGPDNRLPSVGVVSFVVRTEAFERGTLRLTCIASLYNLYAARSELIFDMEQPEVASVLGVRNSAVDPSSCSWRIALSLMPFLYNIR